jgi:Na+/phosphate symporter
MWKGGLVMVEELATREMFNPIFAKLGDMVGAARDAFNRHSGTSLGKLKKLHGELAQEIKSTEDNLETLAAKAPENQRASVLRLQSVLTHLKVIGDILLELSPPIEQKMKEGILFSDKAVAQANQLFDHLTGILRSILDTLKTDNDFLKRYVLDEGQRLTQACNDFATEHEARLIEGVCLPQAAPLFLALLNGMRTIGQHAVTIAKIVSPN